jgi:hypothetical protein
MIEVILFHWTTYLFLAWLALIAVVNLWPRKTPGNPLKGRGVCEARGKMNAS